MKKIVTVNDEPKLLELNDLKDGIYFYQILSANTLVKSSKVVIIK